MMSRCPALLRLTLPLLLLPCAPARAGTPAPQAVLVRDLSSFAWDLYRELAPADENLFFSPYSISTAFAMTYAGARGSTEKEMAKALRLSLGQETLHPAMAALAARLSAAEAAGGLRLDVANALWPDRESPLLKEFLALVRTHYGVAITAVDFQHDHEAARAQINRWVEEKTQDKIQNLVPAGTLGPLTRLVLVNAIYFKGSWAAPFDATITRNAPFHVTAARTVQAPLMTRKAKYRYASLERLDVIELPYAGDTCSMLVLLPKAVDGLKDLEKGMSVEKLDRWRNELAEQEVVVALPRFKMTSLFQLDESLRELGLVDAFDARADFSGMAGRPGELFIGAAVHKAFVEVNEEGTEAAAATAIVMNRTMARPPTVFRADHPFLFLITEKETGAILFLGRLADPTVTGE